MHRARLLLSLLVLAGLLAGLMPGLLGAREVAPAEQIPQDDVVVRLYFDTRAQLDAVASQYDVWEVQHDAGYLVAMLSASDYTLLLDQGYRMEVDEELTGYVRNPDSIPGYPCYRTVEETYTSLQTLNTTYPDVAELIDYGDSWDLLTPGGPAGYELYALRITNEDIPLDDKPVFVLFAENHARELVTSESAMRLAEYILAGYGTDPVLTFFVDYNQIYIVPMTNPDGRKFAETGEWWRKNTDNDDGCTSYPDYGTDLNRNYAFKWGCCGGSSGSPCYDTYRGPSRLSEPETATLGTLIQSLIPDQNGANGDDEIPSAAPADATGLVISLHSYSELVLWPWGFQSADAPNAAGLQTIGVKFATYNGYTPQQGWDLYTTDGGSDDWVYGKLGVPSYTFEMGTSFFQSCSSFESTIWPDNRPALLYAWTIADTPYMTAYGPDGSSATASPNPVPRGDDLTVNATINDQQNGNQTVTGAELYILPLHGATAPGAPGTGIAMSPVDGNWSSPQENVRAIVDTASYAPGDYIIAIRGKDAGNNWGPFTAAFVTVEGPSNCFPVEILDVVTETAGCTVDYAVVVSGTEPFDYAWDFGAFGSSTEPAPTVAYGLPGTYAYTLTVTNCITGTATAQGTVTVECCVPPSAAALEYTPAEPLVGEEVVFTGTVESNRPVTYTWAFGDGGVGSGAVVTHTYEAGGSYEVTMEAANECGVAEVTETVAVCAPVTGLDFTWVPDPAPVDTWIAFHAAAEGTAPIGYAWAFGDGGTGSGANVSHRYTAAGTYTVVVTGTNCGGDVVVEHAVQVVPAGCDPVHEVELAWAPALPLVGEVVVFTGTAAGDEPIGYAWSFGDGGVGSGAEASHAYAAAGVYTVTLTAANCGGVTAEAEGVVTVAALPCAEVEIISVTAAVNGCRVQYAAEVSGDPLFSYLWAFGDGLTSTVAVPTHIYGSTGVYSGTLEVWNCGGVGHDTYAYVVAVDCAAPTEWSVYLPVVFK